jgi:xanthine dehydrogenase accessory factor
VHKELELWQFIAERLKEPQPVMLLVVAESSGSSPGRQGYKMAIGVGGGLSGSIGGGVMEVNLVEQSRELLGAPGYLHTSPPGGADPAAFLKSQIHRRNEPNASGMICSGKQTVIFRLLTLDDTKSVETIIESLKTRKEDHLNISPKTFAVGPPKEGTRRKDIHFEKQSDTDFSYSERLGPKNDLFIVGGGHCALALSELMSRMDFCIRIFDDRPELNTIEKNRFADEIRIIDNYESIADLIPSSKQTYVVVMTLGYKSDEVVIKKLLDKEFRYFGVLGSKAKMKALLNELKKEGYSADKLVQIHTPIGLPINSRTPEEIAVSIAAEIIAVKNAV